MVVGEVNIDADVVVIGGGPGGYVSAIRAAELGFATVLVERDAQPGGICLHRGCIPSKALLAAANAAHLAREAQAMGVRISDIVVDMASFGAWQRGIVDRLTRGVATLLDKHGVTVVRGEGVLAGANRVAVATSHGAERYTAHRGIVIASGARPRPIGGLRPDGARVLAASDAFFIDRVPASAAIIGADYIAVELAVALRKLGSEVTMLGFHHHLLPEIDQSLVPLAERGLRRLGIEWKREARALEPTHAGVRVVMGEAVEQEELIADLIVVSSDARIPNTDELGLDLTGVKQHDEGFILVDERQETSVPGIYAVGDVTPGAAWAHRAYRQGKVAAEAIAGRAVAFDQRVVPAVVLAEPELASAGLSEQDARELGYDPMVTRYPWAASGRALTLGAADGQTVVVSDRTSGILLGVHIAGPGAGELIGEAALALEMCATLEDVALTIHPHPTLSEGIMEAAELALGLPTHLLP